MTEEQKQALTGLCKIEIRRWKAASEANPNMRYMVDLMGVALAALTAQPIGRVDRGAATESNEYPDASVTCLHEHVGWEAFQDGCELFTRPAPAVSLVDLVSESWKLVPVEPTEDMIVAISKGLAERVKPSRYRAMLDAAPEPE